MSRHIIETEESLIIETPERVQLEFSLASIGNRFLAVAIDHFIQYFAIFIVIWIILSLAGPGGATDNAEEFFGEMPNWTKAILILLMFLIFAGYFIIFEWWWNGQTPGKRLLKLRVIRDDGRPITLWEAIARNLLRICDAAPGFVIPIYSIGLVTIFLNDRDQRIGDIFADFKSRFIGHRDAALLEVPDQVIDTIGNALPFGFQRQLDEFRVVRQPCH